MPPSPQTDRPSTGDASAPGRRRLLGWRRRSGSRLASTPAFDWVDSEIAPEAAHAYESDGRSGLDGLATTTLYLGCGVGLYFWVQSEPHLAATGVAALALLALTVWHRRWLPFAALALGLFLSAWHAASVMPLPPSLPETARKLSGVVEALEVRQSGRTRLVLRVTDGARGVSRTHVSTWQTPDELGAIVGHTVSVRTLLYRPPGPALPYRYDHSRRLFFQDVQAMGTAVGRVWTEAPPSGWRDAARASVEALRMAIAERIEAAMPERTAGMAQALLIGVRGAIDPETLETVRRSGLAHVLAISGLHMGLICSLLFVAARYALSLGLGTARWVTPKKAAATVALLGGAVYLIVSGYQIATQRAYVMVLVSCLAILLDRPALTFRNIAIAAIIILATQPESLLSAGFQMSFAATAALVYVFGAWNGRRDGRSYNRLTRTVGSLVGTSAVAGAASGLFAAYHFNAIAAYGLLANVLAMPIFGAVVMPAGLIAMLGLPFGLEGVPLAVMDGGLRWVIAVAEFVTGLEGATRAVSGPSVAVLVAASIIGCRLFASGRIDGRGLALGGGLALVLSVQQGPAPNLIVAENGKTFAVRSAPEAPYRIIGARSSSFTSDVWGQSLGAVVDEAASCDGGGCVLDGPAGRIVLSTRPQTVLDGCLYADLLITPLTPPASCAGEDGPTVIARGRDNAGSTLYDWRDGRLVELPSVSTTRPWRTPPDR